MSEANDPAAGGLVPVPERRLVHAPGGLAARGRALAARLVAAPTLPPQPGEARCLRSHAGCVVGVALSADARIAFSGSWDGTARIWEVLTGRELRRLEGHGDRIAGVALASDGRWAMTGGWDGTARVWDWERGEEVGRFGEPGGEMVHCVALSPDGRHAAWGAGAAWGTGDVLSGAVARQGEAPVGAVRCLAVSPDGGFLLTGSGEASLGAGGRARGALCLWDMRSGERLWGWAGAMEPVLAVAFSPDGRLAFCSTGWPARGRLNATHLWEVGSGKEVARYPAHRQPVFAGAFLPDGRHLLLGGRDRLLRLWDPIEEAEVGQLAGHTDTVFSVAISKDGGLALSGSGDGTARLWRLPGTNGMRTGVPAPLQGVADVGS